jgi:arsenate reductase-like glutaredoxin family protein
MKTKKEESKKGLTSNPSGDKKVNKAKKLMQDALDLMKEVEAEEVKKSENGITREKWEKSIIRTNIMHHILNALNEDYKEIEKEQKCYSKEEVIDILMSMPVDSHTNIIEWFEQFKNK